VWVHWSWSFCCGPQGEALGLLDPLFWYASTRAQQQTLHLPSMVRPPTKRALVTHSPYTHPRYTLLDLPRDVIHSVARFRLRAHTLWIETVAWTYNTSPACDWCNAKEKTMQTRKTLFAWTKEEVYIWCKHQANLHHHYATLMFLPWPEYSTAHVHPQAPAACRAHH